MPPSLYPFNKIWNLLEEKPFERCRRDELLVFYIFSYHLRFIFPMKQQSSHASHTNLHHFVSLSLSLFLAHIYCCLSAFEAEQHILLVHKHTKKHMNTHAGSMNDLQAGIYEFVDYIIHNGATGSHDSFSHNYNAFCFSIWSLSLTIAFLSRFLALSLCHSKQQTDVPCHNQSCRYWTPFSLWLSAACSSAPINMQVQPLNRTALVVRWSRPEITYDPPIISYLISYSWTRNDEEYEETYVKGSDQKLVSHNGHFICGGGGSIVNQ